jgi:hypothetical protein
MSSTTTNGDHSLQITSSISFARHKGLNVAGRITVTLELHNRGDVDCVGATVSAPDVGIRFDPADDWQASYGPEPMRRVIFAHRGQSQGTIAAGEKTTFCTLYMTVRGSSGGCINIAGIDRPLKDLADIRFFCTVGAGNVASGRSPVVIAADDIREAIGVMFGRWGSRQFAIAYTPVSVVDYLVGGEPAPAARMAS